MYIDPSFTHAVLCVYVRVLYGPKPIMIKYVAHLLLGYNNPNQGI